jgi:hypothetical protein
MFCPLSKTEDKLCPKSTACILWNPILNDCELKYFRQGIRIIEIQLNALKEILEKLDKIIEGAEK